jgi:hypothetical protein
VIWAALMMTGIGWWAWCGGIVAEEWCEQHRAWVMGLWSVLALPAVALFGYCAYRMVT